MKTLADITAIVSLIVIVLIPRIVEIYLGTRDQNT